MIRQIESMAEITKLYKKIINSFMQIKQLIYTVCVYV